jgi:hypothetical protein
MKLNEINFTQVYDNLRALKRKVECPDLVLQVLDNDIWKEYRYPFNAFDTDRRNIFEEHFRIKPEPQYRPYAEVKEEWIGKKVNIVSESVKGIITNIKEDTQLISVAGNWYRLERMFQVATWGNNGDANDGKPFGEVVE